MEPAAALRASFQERALTVPLDQLEAPPLERHVSVRAVLAGVRPRQWTGNLLVFAGVVFAAEIGDAGRWADALLAFAAYCAASTAAVLANDILDAWDERGGGGRAPALRGIASWTTVPLIGVFASAALAAAAALGWQSVVFMVSFLAVEAAYLLVLRDVALLDVMAIAALFVIRAGAGAAAVHVHISPWLLLCTALLALFLGLAKTHAELAQDDPSSSLRRPALTNYSSALVDQLIAIVAASTLMAYSMYTFSARDSTTMMVTIPFVVFGIFRLIFLLQSGKVGESPEDAVFRDVPLAVTLAGWATTSAIVLSVS
jgi:4-hydroxybenzoate polyprenyltransferase